MAEGMHLDDEKRNDDSLMAEFNQASDPGLEHILSENDRLHTEK